jgi:predicted MPP superfamily phosphohydrolase
MKLLGFEFGAFGPLHVRHERVALGLARPVRLLYASDLHLGHWWTRSVPAQLLVVARQTRPDVVLLGGDLTDHGAALPDLVAAIRLLADVAVVAAVPGNHDGRAGCDAVRDAVRAAGGHWLPQAPLTLGLRLEGMVGPGETEQPRVLCAHDPSVFPHAAAAGYRLVLAGHLHGGQCILATFSDKLYPAVWLNRWHGLRFQEAHSLMLVSRGLADTLPVRFNCPREVVLCEVE